MISVIKIQILISAFILLTGNGVFTNCVTISGHVKNAKQEVVKGKHRILVYQGNYLITIAKSAKTGEYLFDVCLGSTDSSETPPPVDFFTVRGKDTLLMASVDGFETDTEIGLDFFLPNKLRSTDRKCPQCKRGDRIYELVYSSKQRKDFTKAGYRYYCLYDKMKF
jgi:hypothetical protein